jgi:hypothetical protein
MKFVREISYSPLWSNTLRFLVLLRFAVDERMAETRRQSDLDCQSRSYLCRKVQFQSSEAR